MKHYDTLCGGPFSMLLLPLFCTSRRGTRFCDANGFVGRAGLGGRTRCNDFVRFQDNDDDDDYDVQYLNKCFILLREQRRVWGILIFNFRRVSEGCRGVSASFVDKACFSDLCSTSTSTVID